MVIMSLGTSAKGGYNNEVAALQIDHCVEGSGSVLFFKSDAHAKPTVALLFKH